MLRIVGGGVPLSLSSSSCAKVGRIGVNRFDGIEQYGCEPR